jgi:hypothetical protein
MFKVNDKVKIKKLESGKEYNGLWFDDEMREIADYDDIHTIGTVEEYVKGNPMYFLDDVELFMFNEDMLQLV